MVLEICTTQLAAALAAEAAGAQRIELCSALDVGGITPSHGLIRQAVARLTIPVHVLIRPREGDFCYSQPDIDVMLDDILYCQEVGAAGVVIGVLDKKQRIDYQCIEQLFCAASGMDITFHRAFDFIEKTDEALEWLIAMGFHRILSSGTAPTAYAGRFVLRHLVERAAGRITIMPGAGIHSSNIAEIRSITGAKEFHMSAKRKAEISHNPTNLQGLETSYWEVDVAEVKAALEF
jgi:copper homeostasis protein